MQPLSSPLLTCTRLSLRRGQRQILDGLDLSLESGTLIALLGPNGAGKSSLLKCLTGELEYKGSITLFGADCQQWDSSQLAHRLGVLPQSSSLNFPFLCEEVVAMGRLPHSEPATRRDEIVAAAMTYAGVEHLAKRFHAELYGSGCSLSGCWRKSGKPPPRPIRPSNPACCCSMNPPRPSI